MAVPEVYVEAPEDTFDPATDWLEALDNAGTDGAQLSHGAQEAFLSGYVPWNKVRSAVRFFLGYAYADDTRLYRDLPAAHPTLPWLYAHAVAYKGYRPQANTDNANNCPYKPCLFPDADNIVPRVTYYEKVQMTVRFRDFGTMRFLPDADIATPAEEYKRYTQVYAHPSVQELTADGLSQLYYAEGSASDPSGLVVPASFPYLMAKTAYVIKWFQVPDAYLNEDPTLFYPVNILNCVGRVNDDTFLNSQKGTLLMQPPEFESGRFALPTAEFGDPLTFWNVTLRFDYFSPDRGGTLYGHNLMPYRKDGKWYYASRNSASTSNPGLYLAADYDAIFDHV